MSSVTVEVHGRRHNVRVKPLAPLSDIVAAALAAEGVATADPAACKLMHGKNALDLGTPLRFANLPTGAKLELITGQERRTGLASRAGSAGATATAPAAASATVGSAVQRSTSQTPPVSPTAAATPFVPAASEVSQPPAPQPSPSAAAAATGSHQPVSQPAAAASSDTGTRQAGAQAAAPQAVPDSAKAAAGAAEISATAAAGSVAAPPPDGRLRQLLGRDAHVFSRADEHAAGDASADLPDEFYDFSSEDYARVHHGWASNLAPKQRASEPLKTAAMRAAEKRAAAAKAGPVPVRVMFRDGLVVQSTFPAADPVSALQDMVERAAEPGASGLHLYTAPPKAVLKTPSATLFEAGLAPAAVVYVGSAAGDAPRLRPDVLALQGPPPPRERPTRAGARQHANGGARAAAQGPPSQHSGVPGSQTSQEQQPRSIAGTKLPKWLKVKK